MVDCAIYNVSLEAFKGLESCLHTLDVSNNNITEFPVRKLQQNFNTLMKLGLRDNKIKHLFPIYNEESEKGIKSSAKNKPKDKTVNREDNTGSSRENNKHHEFYSLQDFDISGWNNGPIQINIINGYAKLMLNELVNNNRSVIILVLV